MLNPATTLHLSENSLGLAIAIRTIVGEADDENDVGQQAVAHTLINRLASGHFGASLGAVCMAERKGTWQYDCWMPSDPNFARILAMRDDNVSLKRASLNFTKACASAEDFTQGAMYYYAPHVIPETPPFFMKLTYINTFGTQRFYR